MVCRVCAEDKAPELMRLRLGKRCSICKACDSKRATAYGKAHSDERSAYNRAYRLRPDALAKERERLAARKSDPEYRARYNSMQRKRRQRDDVKAYNRAYWHRYDETKRQAHAAVKYAVATGRLVKADACEDCGATVRLHGHHDDYSQPLVVRWLCPLCHKAAHAVKEKVCA